MSTYKVTYVTKEYATANIEAENDEEARDKAEAMEIVEGSWENCQEMTDRMGNPEWDVTDIENEDGDPID